MSKSISMNIEDIWEGEVPPPFDAARWAVIGEPGEDNVILYFEDDANNFVQIALIGDTMRGTPKSSEFAEDLADVTGYLPS